MSFLAPCLSSNLCTLVRHRNIDTSDGKNLEKMQEQQPDNLHSRVSVDFTNFWETVLAYKHWGSKLDACHWRILSEPNTLSEEVPSVSQRQEICLLQPAVTSDAHIMPSLPWRNMTGLLTVQLTVVFRTRGLAIFYFSPLYFSWSHALWSNVNINAKKLLYLFIKV